MKAEALLPFIDSFAGKNIVVVGDVFIDQYIRGVVERLNPEAPVPILRAQTESEMTGGAGNTAKNAAQLGASTILVSVVGDDPTVDNIDTAADKEGYITRLVRDRSRPTIRKVRYLVGSQQLLRVDYEHTDLIASEIEAALIAELHQVITEETDAVIVSDYAKGVITERAAQTIMNLAKQHNVLVAADIKPSRVAFFKGVSFISPNLKEAQEFLGLNPLEHTTKSPAELAQLLCEKMDTNVFLTLGAGGMYVYTKNGVSEHIPQEHVAEVFDVSGAGDTAIATLTLAQLAGASPQQAAMLGNAAGAVVVGKVGSVGLTSDELKGMVTHHHS